MGARTRRPTNGAALYHRRECARKSRGLSDRSRGATQRGAVAPYRRRRQNPSERSSEDRGRTWCASGFDVTLPRYSRRCGKSRFLVVGDDRRNHHGRSQGVARVLQGLADWARS